MQAISSVSSLKDGESTTTVISTDTQQSEELDDFSVISYQNYGWKTILLLQFQPQFEAVLMLSIYLAYICPLIDIAYAYSTPVENIHHAYSATGISFLYSFDVIYVVDILSMISYKNTEWPEVQHLYSQRHTLMIILDIISIVPLDAVYYSLTDANMRLIYALRLRYILRIFRFIIRISQLKNTVGHNKLLIELLEFLICFSLVLITISCIHYLIECQSKYCAYRDSTMLVEALYITSVKMTSKGHLIVNSNKLILFILFVSTNFFSFLHISGFTIGQSLIATMHKFKRQYVFENMQQLITRRIQRSGCKDPLLFSTSKTFFNLFWKNREGIVYENFDIKIIPEVMAKEISLDITWDSLKHSHLFRDREVHFLRFIAPLVKQKFMIPGEVIYRRNHFKSAMVYIISGVIQILSEQDGETPILSFSGGTCIGESTLLVDYPSSCTVICQNYCEVNILYKKDFLKVLQQYPQEYTHMLETVKNRYNEVKQFQNIQQYMLNTKAQKVEVLTLKWLKTTLQELMIKDASTLQQYERSLYLTDRNTKAEFDRLVFCTSYLDMLVITEQIELESDTVFLKDTCPCILQPDSFIVTVWNTVIAITVLIYIFIYPYYASFQPNVSDWYLIYAYMTTGLYAFDIYIKLSTAVKTEDRIIMEISEIATIKLKTYTFFTDIISTIPVELFVLLVIGDLSLQAFVLLQVLRLLKSYRIRFLFDTSLSQFGVITQTYLKNTVYMIILIYYIAAILYLKLCFKSECEEDNLFLNFMYKISSGQIPDTVIIFVYLSAQQVTNLRMGIPVKGNLTSLYAHIIIIELVATLFYIYFLTNVSAVETLKRYDKLKIQEYLSDVVKVLQHLNVNSKLCRQVVIHIRGQLQYNRGIDILYDSRKSFLQYYHPILSREIRYTAYGRTIRYVPLFINLPDKILRHITSVFRVRMFAPGEIITYAGEVCKEMHIIQNGFCERIEPSIERTSAIVKSGYAISALEICLGIPVINNVVTITHCEVLTANYEEFIEVLQLYPAVFKEMKNTAKALATTTNMEAFFEHQNFDEDFYQTKDDESKSFKNFGYFLTMDTKEGVDYHTYFDKVGYFTFIKYLFLRHTIKNYGSFIRYWQMSRSIFAFATCILAPIPLIHTCTDCIWPYVLLILDVTAWIDIYVQHHICYFDEKGIEITHPLKTAIYYWKHSFAADLTAVLPFEVLVMPLLSAQSENRAKVFLKTIRLLQIHRILRGVQFLERDIISPPKIWTLIKFIPVIVITINTISSMIINLNCEFGPTIKATEKFSEGVTCYPGTWLSESDFAKPLSPIRTQLYGLFFATVTITGPGLGGFTPQNTIEAIEITILSVVGFWCFIYMSAKIIAANLFRNADLTLYQESMHNLVKFLSYRRIDVKLKEEVIRHFEYIWLKTKGKNLSQLIKNTNYALKEDVLFDVYGKTMKESAIFAEANNSFFRSLLLNVKHEIVMNRGIICKVNDVNKKMYFVFKGQVEVLGPDYNHLLILPIGSLFGNLDDCPISRQTLTMVAKGHVELLSIESSNFYKILAKYHTLKFHYHQLISVNTDYLLGSPSPQTTQQESLILQETVHTKVSTKSMYRIAGMLNTIKQHSGGTIWDIIILTFVCYLGSVLELYQITVQDHGLELLAFLYCLDVLYIIDIYLNFQTGYEDEYGILITDKKKIAIRYITSYTGFGLDVATIIPFEIIALIFINSPNRWVIWSYCRCNRLIRMFFVIRYFRIKNQQLNINVYIMRTMSLIAWVSLLLQVLGSLLTIVSCINPKFNVSPLMTCDWANMSSLEKIDVYLRQFSIVLYYFTALSTNDYFPNSTYLILFSVCLLIGGRFLMAIFVAEISATLEIVLHNRLMYENHIHILREHMLRERTSPALLERVWLYVCLLWTHKRGLQFPNFLEEAPYYLREGVLNSMFGYHIRKHALLRLCHIDLIRQMTAQMRPRTFFPGDYITFVNDMDECMYFIHEGAVDALSEDEMYTERIERTLYEGEMFGYDQGLYLQSGHEYTYRANTYSVIIVLERKKWIHLLEFFPASQHLIYKENSH